MISAPPISAHAVAAMALTLVTLLLFSRKRWPLEISALVVLGLLLALFELFPFYAEGATEPVRASIFLQGFGHEALISVCALMVLGQGLIHTGVFNPISRALGGVWRKTPMLFALMSILGTGLLSGFINNTPIVILMLPVLLNILIREHNNQMLLPIGLATIIGGMATSIGTSTNLLVVSIAADLDAVRFSMFDFFPIALSAGLVGYAYLWLAAPLILKRKRTTANPTSQRTFFAELKVHQAMSLASLLAKTSGDISILRIQRKDYRIFPSPDIALKEGDLLLVQETREALRQLEQDTGCSLYHQGVPLKDDAMLTNDNQHIAEIAITEDSLLVGRRARYMSTHFEFALLAIHRAGEPLPQKRLGDNRLAVGDILLIQAGKSVLERLQHEVNLLLLDGTTPIASNQKAPLALAIFVATILVTALDILPIHASAILGCIGLFVGRVIRWSDATHAISSQIVLVVAVSLALGQALMATGATEWLAWQYLTLTEPLSIAGKLSGLILFMAILTNIVSNHTAAVVGTPIAISIAASLNVPADAFILAVLFGANMSFATPFAYTTNLIVMNAGGYTFGDFLRFGGPLVLLMWATLSVLLPLFYGL